MSPPSNRPGSETIGEERVDVRRYLDAVRRGRWLILMIVIVVTGSALALSLALPDTYVATSRIVMEDRATAFGESDSETVRRRLATTNALLTTPRVLQGAARRVPGETADSIEDKVSSAVDSEANIISIDASDEDPERAADVANAVAGAFLQERARVERARISQAREQLEQEILALEGTPNAAVQIPAIRERISELTVSEGSAGADLQIAERADPPSEPSSPRPVRNSVLAFFAALFLGVLVALGRDQLVPRVSGPRELGRLLDLPVLAEVPSVGGPFRRRRQVLSGVEMEAYQTLRANLELALRRADERVLLITGAMHAEGKTTATARLGRALADSGRRVLLVSADLRVPRLHELFGLPQGVGLADILTVLEWEGARVDDDLLEQSVNVVMAPTPGKDPRGALHVITTGTKAKDPGRLISGRGLEVFLDYLRELDYEYVILDGPPLLGIADSQVFARHADDVLIVSRVDRISLDRVQDLRDVLDRLPTKPLGIVAIGARGELSPYYLARGPLIQEEEASA